MPTQQVDERIVNPAQAHEMALAADQEMTAAVKASEAAKELGDLAISDDFNDRLEAMPGMQDRHAEVGTEERARAEVVNTAEGIAAQIRRDRGALPESGEGVGHYEEAADQVRLKHEKKADHRARVAGEMWEEKQAERVAADRESVEENEQVAA